MPNPQIMDNLVFGTKSIMRRMAALSYTFKNVVADNQWDTSCWEVHYEGRHIATIQPSDVEMLENVGDTLKPLVKLVKKPGVLLIGYDHKGDQITNFELLDVQSLAAGIMGCAVNHFSGIPTLPEAPDVR